MELLGIHVITLGEFNRVSSRQNPGSFCSVKQDGCGRGNGRGLEPHRPTRAIEATTLAARNGVYKLSTLIKDLNLQIAKDVTSFLVVGDLCGGRPLRADERFVSFGRAVMSIDVLPRGPAWDEDRLFGH